MPGMRRCRAADCATMPAARARATVRAGSVTCMTPKVTRAGGRDNRGPPRGTRDHPSEHRADRAGEESGPLRRSPSPLRASGVDSSSSGQMTRPGSGTGRPRPPRSRRPGRIPSSTGRTSRGSGASATCGGGDLYRELGELEEAEGWYRMLETPVVAYERLGELCEETDRPGGRGRRLPAVHRRPGGRRRGAAGPGRGGPEAGPGVDRVRGRDGRAGPAGPSFTRSSPAAFVNALSSPIRWGLSPVAQWTLLDSATGGSICPPAISALVKRGPQHSSLSNVMSTVTFRSRAEQTPSDGRSRHRRSSSADVLHSSAALGPSDGCSVGTRVMSRSSR